MLSQKISWCYNILFFNTFKFEVFITKAISYPMYKLLVPKDARDFLTNGEDDMENGLIESFENPEVIGNSFISSLTMVLLVAMTFFGLLALGTGLAGIQLSARVLLVVAVAAAMIANYLLSHKENKYVNYFKEIETVSNIRKNKHAILSAVAVLSIFFFTAVIIKMLA